MILRAVWVLLFLVPSGCGYFQKTPEPQPTADPRVGELQARYSTWLKDLQTASDNVTGWPSAVDCDGTFWAGQAAAAGDENVNLSLAEASPGRIIRSPVSPCTPASRDDVLGFAVGSWMRKDLAALRRLRAYGDAHGWVMSADTNLSTIDPTAQALIVRAIDHLSGTSVQEIDKMPLACLALSKDFERQLEAVTILLAGDIDGSVSDECAGVMRTLAKDNPADALFAVGAGAFSGDMNPALSLILNPDYACPSYVRGAGAYSTVHHVFVAKMILRRYGL